MGDCALRAGCCNTHCATRELAPPALKHSCRWPSIAARSPGLTPSTPRQSPSHPRPSWTARRRTSCGWRPSEGQRARGRARVGGASQVQTACVGWLGPQSNRAFQPHCDPLIICTGNGGLLRDVHPSTPSPTPAARAPTLDRPHMVLRIGLPPGRSTTTRTPLSSRLRPRRSRSFSPCCARAGGGRPAGDPAPNLARSGWSATRHR